MAAPPKACRVSGTAANHKLKSLTGNNREHNGYGAGAVQIEAHWKREDKSRSCAGYVVIWKRDDRVHQLMSDDGDQKAATLFGIKWSARAVSVFVVLWRVASLAL